MKRKSRSEMKALSHHAPDDNLLKQFPELNEFMRAATFDGEEGVRESPTVTFWCGGGEWKASVKDRAEGLVMWLSASSLGDLLHLLETFVGSSDGPWRHDDHQHERNGKRVKKGT